MPQVTKGDHTINVSESALPLYQNNGWTAKTSPGISQPTDRSFTDAPSSNLKRLRHPNTGQIVMVEPGTQEMTGYMTSGWEFAPEAETTKQPGASMVWKGPDGLYRVFVNGSESYSTGDKQEATEYAQRFSSYYGNSFNSSTMNMKGALDFNRSAANEFAVTPGVTVGKPTTGQSQSKKEEAANKIVETLGGNKDYPEELTSIPGFNDLPEEEKAIVNFNYGSRVKGLADVQVDMAEQLEVAKGLSGPYYKGLINYTQDELSRDVSGIKEDASMTMERLAARKDEIKQDLSFNREQLTLEEQADMARLSRDYDTQLRTVQTNAQESGLIFSSPRELAETELEEGRTDVAESTARRFARSRRELQTGAGRALDEIGRKEQETESLRTRGITEAARAAEKQLGSEGLPDVEGVPKLGGIEGDLKRQEDLNILDLQRQLVDKINPQYV